MTTLETPVPWYKEGFVWFLIAGPSLVVIACMVTIWLAVTTDDGLVSSDYYREGLYIERDLSRVAKAKALNLSGEMTINIVAENQTQVRIRLFDAQQAVSGNLRLVLHHFARAGLDREVVLQPSQSEDGSVEYATLLPQGLHGKWRVLVHDEQEQWALRGVLNQASLVPLLPRL